MGCCILFIYCLYVLEEIQSIKLRGRIKLNCHQISTVNIQSFYFLTSFLAHIRSFDRLLSICLQLLKENLWNIQAKINDKFDMTPIIIDPLIDFCTSILSSKHKSSVLFSSLRWAIQCQNGPLVEILMQDTRE